MYFFNAFDSFEEGGLCYLRGRVPYSVPCQQSAFGFVRRHREEPAAPRCAAGVVNVRGLTIGLTAAPQRRVVCVIWES